MPDFTTALVAWLGFGIGYAVGMLLSLPLSGLLAARIGRRRAGVRHPYGVSSATT